jgi:hypothetical protein
MRSFLISSTKYNGQVELVYNSTGRLSKIDFTQTNLSVEQVFHFKNLAPVTLQHLENKVGLTANMVVVESNYNISFDEFWTAYDKKINRKRCEPIWLKLSNNQQVLAWAGIKEYNKFLHANSWRKKADPENYLKSEMWNNVWS